MKGESLRCFFVLFPTLFRIVTYLSRLHWQEGPRAEGVSNNRTTRRRFLQLAAGATVASQTPLAAGANHVRETRAELSDGVLLIEFDPTLRSRLSNLGAGRRRAITPWTSTEYLRLSGGEPLDHFVLREEHTSELQSLRHLVCRLLLEKKKQYLETRVVRPFCICRQRARTTVDQHRLCYLTP